jgi:hypothetical protein
MANLFSVFYPLQACNRILMRPTYCFFLVVYLHLKRVRGREFQCSIVFLSCGQIVSFFVNLKKEELDEIMRRLARIKAGGAAQLSTQLAHSMCEDDIAALVLDNGSGCARPVSPGTTHHMPSIVGRPRQLLHN